MSPGDVDLINAYCPDAVDLNMSDDELLAEAIERDQAAADQLEMNALDAMQQEFDASLDEQGIPYDIYISA